MKRDAEQKVTLEDLLRLKRAERPPDEFWARFESEIRAKQLSAIVSKRPWWDRFSGVFAVARRHQLSFGAAAAIALAFAGVRFVGGYSEIISAPKAATVRPAAPAPAAPVRVAAAIERTARPQEEAELALREAAPQPRPAVVAATVSHMTQVPAEIAADAASRSLFAGGIAITLADFREPATTYPVRSAFGTDSDFEPAIGPARQQASDPLARVDPAEERRARLLAPALPAYASGSPRAVAGDWMRDRDTSDDRMYESMDKEPNDHMLVGFRF
jgi:hypothetical protein